MAARKPKTEKVLQVVGPLATPYLENGERIYLYQGAIFPSNLREGESERFLDLGLVAEVEGVAEGDDSTEEPAEA